MFRHRGKSRTLSHNLRIASVLSAVAGVVNISGFMSIGRLTTNVTGHFAFLIDEVFQLEWWRAFVFFAYIFAFFAGSFTSSFIVEDLSRRKHRHNYTRSVLLESAILLALGLTGPFWVDRFPHAFACALLFAMGLQNSLVTTLSNAIVRTTHLTGLFTDLGIEFSQLFFYREKKDREKLTASIKLRLTIICFFFIGGICGGILFTYVKLYALVFASLLLGAAAIYDSLKLRFANARRLSGF